MATDNAELTELLLEILTNNPCLHTSHHIILIDPPNFIHAGHIDRHDHPLLSDLAHQGFSDVGASSIGDEHDVVLHCLFNEVFSLLVIDDVDHEVDGPLELAASQNVHLLQGVAVGVVQAGDFGVGEVVDLPGDVFEERLVFEGWGNWDLALGLDLSGGV